MNQKELVTAIIKADIVYSRVLNGINAIGFSSEEFTSGLPELAFKIMEVEDSDERFSAFTECIWEIDTFGFEEWKENVEPLAEKAYNLLLSFKNA